VGNYLVVVDRGGRRLGRARPGRPGLRAVGERVGAAARRSARSSSAWTTAATNEIVAAAAALANALELTSVAEGVESADQALAVTGVGFRYAQGFYFGAPADAGETVRRLGGGRFTSPRRPLPKAAAGS